MVHRESRDRLALALRRYVSGRMTNDDLDAVDVDWRDRGAVAVKEMSWFLYDDTRRHFVEARIPRGSEARRTIATWVMFLHSDTEYLWPEYSFISVMSWPMNILTLGWWSKREGKRREEFLEAGDIQVWPFSSRAELERAASSPRMLAGAAQPGVAADGRRAGRS